MTFVEMKLSPATHDVLNRMKIIDPTPIQAAATPELLAGRDVVGQARTGSGKTLAFSIPIVERCDPTVASVQALVLVPTRELAFQVGGVIDELAAAHRLRCAFLYGGRDVSDQQTLLSTGPQIVIGTPGRLIDLLYRGNLRLNDLRLLIIDEADEMLDEGFGPDVDQLLDCILQKPQIALFSATIPDWVEEITSHRLSDPVTIKVDSSGSPIDTVTHTAVEVSTEQKLAALRHLVDTVQGSVVVFCRTKTGVERLAGQLSGSGYDILSLQGNLSQPERERVMRAFRRGHPRILVATNVAARGLDVAGISRVINYDLPDSPELLTHRLGRTGRMGREGEAMTLVTPRDTRRWSTMQRALGISVTHETWQSISRNGSVASNGHAETSKSTPRTRQSAPRGPAVAPSTRSNGQTQRPNPPRQRSRDDAGSNGRRMYDVVCEGCGAPTRVPFEPTPTRPGYCRDCKQLVSL